eukprot:527927_1
MSKKKENDYYHDLFGHCFDYYRGQNKVTMNKLNTLIKIVDIKKEHLQTSQTLRKELMVGSKCQIYSKGRKKMFSGKVVGIFTDNEGEWLEVEYGTRQKQIPRD